MRCATAAACVAFAAAGLGCGDSPPGLSVLDYQNERFDLHCGVTAIWDAGVVANAAKDTAVVRSITLDHAPSGFSLAWARARLAPVGNVQEQHANRQMLGLRIPPAGEALPDAKHADSSFPGWHLVAGIHT